MNFIFIISWLFLLTSVHGAAISLPDRKFSSKNGADRPYQPNKKHRWVAESGHRPYERSQAHRRDSNANSVSSFKSLGSSSSESGKVQTLAEPVGLVYILPTPAVADFANPAVPTTDTLDTFGQSKTTPLLTQLIPPPSALLEPAKDILSLVQPPTTSLFGLTMPSKNIFAEPIDTKAPSSCIATRDDHPVPRKGITSKGPLETNKFYSNFFLGDQRQPTYTFPYSIAWAGGKGSCSSWGLWMNHVEASQRVFGKVNFNNAAEYYLSPVGIESMIVSAKELQNGTVLTTDSLTPFSARISLSKDNKSPPAVSFPLMQGMTCITAQYNGAVPVIQSGVTFKTMTRVTQQPKEHVTKFNFNLQDGTVWRVYGFRTSGEDLDLKVTNSGYAESNNPFCGVIQVCKDPGTPGSEAILDDSAGIYPVTMTLSGSVAGAVGTYNFNFEKSGHDRGNLYMFALPHHVQSFQNTTKQQIQNYELLTTTKGEGTLVKGTKWTMVESKMPVDMEFAPWDPKKGSVQKISDQAKSIIRSAAETEISQDMIAQSNLDSMYFSGKALTKFGLILYVIEHLLCDQALAQSGLGKLKAAFAIFAANKQKYPLVHETAWGGVVSSATYTTGQDGADFGNTYYNDHHFHYGYHILAAALIGRCDKTWVDSNKDYVNTLVRDIANPSAKDGYFPMWRSFDWYHGHSWAHGLYASADGKDQESSSEDVMHAYALKMWGQVSGDHNLEARANLQLAILSRSLQNYYLYQDDNKVQPAQFIGNKVAGILFENKVHHTTYFSPEIEAIQGIHMIPVLPSTPLVRVAKFVQQEWDAFFSNGRLDKIDNAWKGIVYASYSTINPRAAWTFFSSKTFKPLWLDGGASLTWSLAYAAALGNI